MQEILKVHLHSSLLLWVCLLYEKNYTDKEFLTDYNILVRQLVRYSTHQATPSSSHYDSTKR